MTKFINVARPGQPELLIDLDDVTLIQERDRATMGPTFGDSDGITLWSKEQGAFVNLPAGKCISAQEIANLLGGGSQSWIKFPVRWPDSDTNENTLRAVYYVRPESFTYAIASVPVEQDNGSAGLCRAVLLGVDGYGCLESTAVTTAEEQALLDAINAANRGLERVDPEEVRARFYHPGYTLYDPAKIDRIDADSIQVNVVFSKIDRVDFSFHDREVDINDIYHGLIKSGMSREEAFSHLDEYRREAEEKIRDDFARAVAAKAPHLNELENAEHPYFVRLDEIATVFVHDDEKTLTLYGRKPKDRQLGSDHTVRFKAPEDCRRAVDKIKAFRPPPPKSP